jgi:threonine dehydrogenase-like Zn-dependent dehydrogenase
MMIEQTDPGRWPNRAAHAVWFTAPQRAELLEAPVRMCGPGDITVRAIASGISQGTETLIYRGEGPTDQSMTPETCEGESMGSFPIKYGYQSVGTVIEAGSESGYAEGDLVFVRFPHQDVYTLTVDPELVYRVPQLADPAHAVFGNLLDVAVNAMLDVPIRIGEVVVVYGLGVVGRARGSACRHRGGHEWARRRRRD